MNREDLLQTLKLATPALLSDNDAVLPILKSLKFTGDHVIASNDVIAVCLAVPVEEAGIVPGRKLINFLGACSAKSVKVSKSKKGNFLVKCGKAQLRLSSEKEDEWPFEFPDIEQARSLSVAEPFFEALNYCSSQSSDTGLGGWQGGIIFLLSTVFGVYGIGRSRATISYCRVEGMKPNEKPQLRIVVPSSFCKAAVTIADVLGKEALLHISEETVVLDWGDGENVLTTKLVDVDMPDVTGRFSDIAAGTKNFIPIGKNFAAALRRAAAIGNEGTSRIVYDKDEKRLRIRAKGSGASLNELVKIKKSNNKKNNKKIRNIDHLIAADLICRRLDDCSMIAFGDRATVMQSESGHFTYVVSNRAEKEKEE